MLIQNACAILRSNAFIGTAIEPCGHDKRFRDVAEVNYKGPVDWNNPPMPNKVIKKGTHDTEKDCYYENDGKGNYGEFNCYDPKYVIKVPGN